MKPLSEIKYPELLAYLTSKYVFGLTCERRKKTIIYEFKKFMYGYHKNLKVKVSRETKYVMSVLHEGKVYTDFDDLKAIIEK